MGSVDQRLVDLCRRDEIIALRDRAKRAAEQGDEQAGFVWAWMEQELARLAATASRGSCGLK